MGATKSERKPGTCVLCCPLLVLLPLWRSGRNFWWLSGDWYGREEGQNANRFFGDAILVHFNTMRKGIGREESCGNAILFANLPNSSSFLLAHKVMKMKREWATSFCDDDCHRILGIGARVEQNKHRGQLQGLNVVVERKLSSRPIPVGTDFLGLFTHRLPFTDSFPWPFASIHTKNVQKKEALLEKVGSEMVDGFLLVRLWITFWNFLGVCICSCCHFGMCFMEILVLVH